MKKNYSNPKFKLVLLDSNDIVCVSGPQNGGDWDYNNGTPTGSAKQRPDIWDE